MVPTFTLILILTQLAQTQSIFLTGHLDSMQSVRQAEIRES